MKQQKFLLINDVDNCYNDHDGSFRLCIYDCMIRSIDGDEEGNVDVISTLTVIMITQ